MNEPGEQQPNPNAAILADRVKAAEQRTKATVRAAAAHTSSNIEQIVLDGYEGEARQAVADFEQALETTDAAIVALIQMANAMAPLISTVPGLDPRAELPSYDGLNGLRRVLRQHRGIIEPPLPRSIVTPEGQQPPRVKYRGGWVSAGNASSSEEQERQRAQQAEREAARARRNPAAA